MITALAIAFDALLSQKFFGNSTMQLLLFAASVLACLAIGTLFYNFLKTRAKKISDSTKNKLDDVILETIDKSFFLVALAIGFALGSNFLSLETGSIQQLQIMSGAIITILVSWLSLKFIDSFTEHYIVPLKYISGQRIDENLLPIFKNIFKAIILIIAAVIILRGFGYDVTAILAGLGIGGIAIAFASQQTIADIFGGVSLLTSKPFRVGETIQVEGITGTVKKVGIRTTRIKGIDNSEITFSNSKLANAIIKNISVAKEQRVELNIGLSQNNSHEKIQAACDTIKKIVSSCNHCAENPTVFFWDYKENALMIQAIFFIKEKEWQKTRHEINLKIFEELKKQEIDFASPMQKAN